MAATKRNMNTRGCTFTSTVPTTTTFTGVTSWSRDHGISLQKFSGDGDRGPTTIVNDFADFSLSISTADIAAAEAMTPGLRGTLVVISKDAKNQTASSAAGDITYTLSNAIVASNSAGGQHRAYAMAQIAFAAEWSDGVTPPLAFAVA